MDQPLFLFALSAALLVISMIRYQRGHLHQAVIILMGAAMCLRLGVAVLDPFLHDWDERFHALVAKNLLSDWSRPLLRAIPVLPYDYQQWCCNHVWLHKQPLFLWQIAGSFWLFGVNEVALRLPSVLLGTLIIWPIYRLGCLTFGPPVGYRAALLFALAYYPLELTSGWQSVDHSDLAFLVYVTASLWAYYESRRSGARPVVWSLLVGLFAGMAVLCKWLPGLVVYAAWSVDLVVSSARRGQAREYGWLLTSAAVALAVFLPWQLYVHHRFPLESAFEQLYASKHFSQVLEDKGGPWYFYLTNLWYQFQWMVLPVAAGLGLLLTPQFRRWPLLPLLVSCGIVFVFFSLAATKMVSYTYMVAPLLLLLAVAAWVECSQWLSKRGAAWSGAATLLLTVVMVVIDLRPTALLKHHTAQYASAPVKQARQRKIQHTAIYRQLDQLVPPGYVVFNVPPLEDVEALFYSHRNVYAWWPAESEYRALQSKGIGIAVFAGPGSPALPVYMQEPNVLLIKAQLE